MCQQQRADHARAQSVRVIAVASRGHKSPERVPVTSGREGNTAPESPVRRLERGDRDRAQPDVRRRDDARARQEWQRGMHRRLQRWKNRCVVCHQQGRDSTHPVSRCREELGKKVERERQIVQRSIRYPSGQVCYRCGIPRTICEGWSGDGRVREVREGGEQRACQFYGVLIGVVYAAKHGYPEIWQSWFEVARRDADWGCQIGRAFMWITEEIEEVDKGRTSSNTRG